MTRCVLLAGLAALAMAGCGGGGGAADPTAKAAGTPEADAGSKAARPPDDAGEINGLLADRARALEAEDPAALAATASGVQRQLDRRAAGRTRRLRIERIRFVPGDVLIDGDTATAKVTMSYRVAGMSRPFQTDRRLTAERTPDGWRIAKDAPRAEPLPWEVAAFRATRTPHVVLLTPPGVDPAELRPGLARAYRDISRDLPSRDLPDRVLVIAARDAAMTERLNGRVARGVVAIANVSVKYRYGPAREVGRVLAQRMIVVDSRWRTLPPAERQSTLVHEMTHTAMDPDTSGRTPAWLAEGMAMYVSDDDRTAEAAARAAGYGPAMKLGPISRPNSIFGLSGREQGAAYATASAAVHRIVERKGTSGLFRFYDAFNDSSIRGRRGAQLTDRVMRRSIGMSLDELDALVAG